MLDSRLPFELLSDDHLARYGRFGGDPTPEQLMDYFRLTEGELDFAHAGMEPHTRLGMAIQLGTLRFLGAFLPDPTDVPRVVVRYVAEQLGISDTRVLRAYLARRRTRSSRPPMLRTMVSPSLTRSSENGPCNGVLGVSGVLLTAQVVSRRAKVADNVRMKPPTSRAS